MLCQACERGDHANCGLQTWCDCDCDPEMVAMFGEPFIEEYEDDPAEDSED